MRPVDAATMRRVRAALVADVDLAGRGLGRRLADQVDAWFESLGADLDDGWSLIAVGGYAQGLLTPGSDVDVVLVHPPRTAEAVAREVAERLWYPIWDAGLKSSPAVHTLDSLRRLARTDLDTATSLLTVRHLAGSNDVAVQVQDAARRAWRSDAPAWLGRLLGSGRERWRRHGAVASLLEPDLKDGRGGLRDHDMLRWALQVDRDEVTAALEVPFADLAGPAEVLLAVRCELHRATGRPSNVLLLEEQDRVADAMGYADADAMMHDLAVAAHAVEWSSARFWAAVERQLDGRRRTGRRRSTELAAGVVVEDGEAHIGPDADVDEQSFVFRFAATAAHAGVTVSRRALRLMASRGAAVGEDWTEATRRSFVSLLGAGEWMITTIESLEQVGLFSRYLPEWRAVRSLPQRNAFHTYTVDHHLLRTVANAGEFVRDVARPDLLLVGALMHDLGKGFPGDHTDAGVALVDPVLGRMGFGDTDRAVVATMVRHHLLLAETATRRDLGDPRTASLVAAAVADPETLRLLRALTEADSRATGPAAWSSWKCELIDELVRLAAGVLAHGHASQSPSVAIDPRLAGISLGDDVVRILHEPVVDRIGRVDLDVVQIVTRDRTGLFATMAGVLALHGLDVVGASATTAGDGTAIDEFRIARVDGVEPRWGRVEVDLREALTGGLDVDARLADRLRQTRTRRSTAASPARLEVLVSNEESAATTVVEVRAPDGPAVLYRVARAISSLGLDIRTAVVATLGHEVVDVFYVATPEGAKLDAARSDELRREVRDRLGAAEATDQRASLR